MEGHDLLQHAMMMRQQSEEVEKQLQFVIQQIAELEEFNITLEELDKSDEKEILAPLGKGVFAKSVRKDEKLYVDVGANVMVRKTPKETKEVITDQIRKFSEARVQLTAQLESFREEFTSMLQQVEQLKDEK